VLVVEDDAKSAELTHLLLEAQGFRVLHTSSAKTALAVAQRHALSLITLDILLPGVDGWELLRQIKATPGLTGIPVVVISIVADSNSGSALGAAAVLQKPLSRQALYSTLAHLGLLPPSRTESLGGPVVVDPALTPGPTSPGMVA
jgi:CheY-like chemotaxis protein